MLKRVKPNALDSGTKRTLVPEELGEFRTEGEPIPVPMELRFLEKPTEIAGKRRVSFSLVAVGVHSLVMGAALLVPLLYTESLELRQLTQTRLVAPPPPRLAPAPATRRAVPTRRTKPVVQTLTRKLVRPTVIPHEIAQKFEPVVVELGGSGAPGDIPDGILGGVPGGVPGGQLGGVIGGVLGGIPTAVPRGPVRLSSFRQPQQVKYVAPLYPSVALRGRIQGDVRIDAIVNTNGRVVEMRVVAGHPLLVKAAMRAVQQWVYEPTYLSGRPIPVVFAITVEFRLG